MQNILGKEKPLKQFNTKLVIDSKKQKELRDVIDELNYFGKYTSKYN
jgi:hypothetical protein